MPALADWASPTALYTFNGSDGSGVYGALLQGADGNFYGTTNAGGSMGFGTVFRISTDGSLTTLHDFTSTDGAGPRAGLVLGSDGNFYGTTEHGGSDNDCYGGCGTVFRITAEGALTSLHSFNYSDGYEPEGRLLQASDGSFYGTTSYGGDNGVGTVFRITTAGVLTSLHSFNSTDGAYTTAGLVQGGDGNLYGTTAYGGASPNCESGCGTVYRITTGGVLTTLHSFDGGDGSLPEASLTLGTDGILYGTTAMGGANGYGAVFKIAADGSLSSLHDFDAADGSNPYDGLYQGSDGKLYGTTYSGGVNDQGSLFQITTAGVFSSLYSFDGIIGAYLFAGLVQGSDGSFYGATVDGGANNAGSLFSFSVLAGLPPPTLNIAVAPYRIQPGQSATLSWSTLDASSCIASGDWSGNQATSGSIVVAPRLPGNYTYTLSCNGAGGLVVQSAGLQVRLRAGDPRPRR